MSQKSRRRRRFYRKKETPCHTESKDVVTEEFDSSFLPEHEHLFVEGPKSHHHHSSTLSNEQSHIAEITDWEEFKEREIANGHLNCAVCLFDFEETDALCVKLSQCNGHFFHMECVVASFGHSNKCPVCSTIYGEFIGDMPPGTMEITRYSPGMIPLSGFEECGTIQISYNFPCGIQGPEHYHPGQSYSGTSRMAYLPNNREGNEVLELLKRGFLARVLFTVGRSITTGCENTVVWNGVHHKTNTCGGPTSFGYPDETYFIRVKEELALKGIR